MIRVGIFFGGNSREREISFAGGRTVFDNLDKSLFTAIPIFIDSLGQMIELDWSFLYKGTIRDFYPPVSFLPDSEHQFQIYIESIADLDHETYNKIQQSIGQPIQISELKNKIDFAFLALHGTGGEDGQLQGLLELLHIPYSGSGIRASSIGMDKSFQKKIMQFAGFHSPAMDIIERRNWKNSIDTLQDSIQKIGFPLVVRPANQGSSIGVSIVNHSGELKEAIDKAFFIKTLSPSFWLNLKQEEKIQWLRDFTDIRYGLGFPIQICAETIESQTIYHPEIFYNFLEEYAKNHTLDLTVEAWNAEQKVVLEGFIKGREFSCVVIQDENGKPIALPPTEIIKGAEVFDYRSKYLAGLSRKITPIDLPDDLIQSISVACEKLFEYIEFNVYARIDGFIQEDGKIILNDPNTTSGMLPSSFFFHQAAEIGLNPSQFLTYIIHASLIQRIRTQMNLYSYDGLLKRLEILLENRKSVAQDKKKIGVILGGYSSERHISVESGRNIYEKLSSSNQYDAIPIFLSGEENQFSLVQLPIHLLLKDNADDIRDKIEKFHVHPFTLEVRNRCKKIIGKFAGNHLVFEPKPIELSALDKIVNQVFIALHGRPGEDGQLQKLLEQLKLPFNGSSSHSAALTINKFETLQKLKKFGFLVADQYLVSKIDYVTNKNSTITEIEQLFQYPFIAKPVDDGCSSAVKKIKNRRQLQSYLEALFRSEEEIDDQLAKLLELKAKEEFPTKNFALIEELIQANGALHFLEITGGLLTHLNQKGEVFYEIFEPSETLAGGEVLSLEEKFLAGEGQNITPARFACKGISQEFVSEKVRSDLEKAAKILEVTGYARIDAFVRIFENGQVETLIIEVNSLPGMTPATCIFHQCALNGYKPSDFIDKILDFGLQRNALSN
jgi:UDP-N-acetylmuramate--alanine ligase